VSLRHCFLLFGRYQDSFSRFTTVTRVNLTHPSQSSAEVMNAWSYRPTSATTCVFKVLYITKKQVSFTCSDIYTTRGSTEKFGVQYICRAHWPRGLRRGSAAARLLGLWVRIPPGARMFVSCECFVLSDRGLCDDLRRIIVPALFECCLTLRLLMSYIYIYGAHILDVSRSHTTTHHSR